MKKKLLNNLFLITFISALGIYQMNAQADIVYAFDGTTWEGWTSQGGTGAFASVFGNSPNGELTVTWSNNTGSTANVVMYAPPGGISSAYKFIQLRISNNSSQIGLFRIRGNDGAWFNAIDEAISTDADGVYSVYNFEITNASWTGNLTNWQIVFRKADGTALTDQGTIKVDNILLSTSTTLSSNSKTAFEFSTYPNPVQDVLHINTKEPLQKVEVYDLLGKNVLSFKIVSEQINVSSLSKSLYILKLTSASGVSTKKFIKE
ncbi:putative secreted protein (Por secretion system target) [Mariniflexile fucanivorans]|uniref:Putative secreted protein (Por secretion system target) n=1 Tax=Mariniflexile fucanivorans TaxID=264023 RepID=A0A4R1RM55_9FLAO|nr:T9SS type A sorting domain-containing protein [Mariniflexile fucanivorans]TCL66882.1 putative secreted protein (Por secretion system target) [Mariniflexile fucanivorans]